MKPVLLVLSSAVWIIAIQIQLLAGSPAKVKATDIRPERELLITHPSVVDSDLAKYPGPWSFGGLLTELVGKEDAPKAVRDWLEQYAIATTASDGANAAVIPGRPEIRTKVIESWQRRDGFDSTKGEPWSPNLANAPFRLLAIVNRIDLVAPELVDVQTPIKNAWKLRGREAEFDKMLRLTGQDSTLGFITMGGYGGRTVPEETTKLPKEPKSIGEGRLVFGAVGEDGRPLEGGWTIIFEYPLVGGRAEKPENIPNESAARRTFSQVRIWAQMWHRLAEYELGDHRYNEVLAQVTRTFTHRIGAAVENGGAQPDETLLGQLRSSEAAFGKDRVFRQFRLQGGKFKPSELPMTPAIKFMEDTPQGGRTLSFFLKATEPLILAGIHTLPGNINDRNGSSHTLLASHAIIPAGEKEFHWDPSPAISRNARRLFSVNTCNGCHAADTGCADGLHIHPRNAGEAAKLSSFLRMDGKPNRFQDPGVRSSYVKQEEISDRAAILAALLEPRENRRLNALEDSLRDRLRRGH